MKWYAFVAKTPKKYIGHNPLAQLAMFLMFVIPLFVAIFTGFALYAEGQGTDSWWYAAFSWVSPSWGQLLGAHGAPRQHVDHHHLRNDLSTCRARRHHEPPEPGVHDDFGWRFFKDDRE